MTQGLSSPAAVLTRLRPRPPRPVGAGGWAEPRTTWVGGAKDHVASTEAPPSRQLLLVRTAAFSASSLLRNRRLSQGTGPVPAATGSRTQPRCTKTGFPFQA